LGDLGVELRYNPQPPEGGYDSVQKTINCTNEKSPLGDLGGFIKITKDV